MNCAQCGADSAGATERCSSCGAALIAATAAPTSPPVSPGGVAKSGAAVQQSIATPTTYATRPESVPDVGEPPATVRIARVLGVVVGVLTILGAVLMTLTIFGSGLLLLMLTMIPAFLYGAILVQLCNQLVSGERSAWLTCIAMALYVALVSLAAPLIVNLPQELERAVSQGWTVARIIIAALAVGWAGLLLTPQAREYFRRDATSVRASVAVAAATGVMLIVLSVPSDASVVYLNEWARDPMPVAITSVAVVVGAYLVLTYEATFLERTAGGRLRFLASLAFLTIAGIVSAIVTTDMVRGVFTGVLCLAALAVAVDRSRGAVSTA